MIDLCISVMQYIFNNVFPWFKKTGVAYIMGNAVIAQVKVSFQLEQIVSLNPLNVWNICETKMVMIASEMQISILKYNVIVAHK